MGICGTRTLQNGKVVSLSYGQSTGLSLDPIEKKPLARFHPGAKILSYGSFGCNMRCPFCQNASISTLRADASLPTEFISPQDLVGRARTLKAQGNIGIALTYNEPFIAWEHLLDCARAAREADLLVAVVTNGYVNRTAWETALPLIDAANIDLKCYTEEGYSKLGTPGGLGVVKESIRSAHAAGVHVEVTTLVVPDFSDREDVFREECAWLASIDCAIPLHITRFFPCHEAAHKRPTSIKVMNRFKHIAKDYLSQVFLGNV
ncbi:MAG: radical SAM protein [Eggerthellaceae bacterium]|nr:radical SAM protein [Eggerthellaceae bacterium]